MGIHGILCRNVTQVKTRHKQKFSLKIVLENITLKEWQRSVICHYKKCNLFYVTKANSVLDAIGVHSKYLFYKNFT